MLQSGQALQTHLQNFLRLGVRQAVQAIFTHAVLQFQPIRTIVVSVDQTALSTGAGEHFTHQLAVPRTTHQLQFRHRRCRRFADDADKVINIGQRHRQTFQHMTAFARLAQFKNGTPGDHLTAMLQKDFNQVFQIA
ncbi:hypothetical protein GALL_482730 [mine drainage metagenome]|uniref:Uncharacterized protein n=1 Tax=mine drainage metagenome TaxID=410659 RepID=A0A1J5PH68_9ZZZZ